MRGFLNSKWIYIANTFPVIVLFFLYNGQIKPVSSLLEENNIRLLTIFGLTLALLGIANLIYAAYLIKKNQKIHMQYGIIMLICYITFIYLYHFNLPDIIPFSIPPWMISRDIYIYVGTFLMPTLCHAFLVLIIHLTPDIRSYAPKSTENESPSDTEYIAIARIHKAWLNFLLAVLIPVAGYVFSMTILPLWQPTNKDFETHVVLILVIIATLTFLFFLTRGIFILIQKRTSKLNQYIWKIPIAILFPLIGLLINNGLSYISFKTNDSTGIFGNFSHYWFYLLAVLNGILICMPDLKNKLYRLFLFIGRCITFVYTFYFFLVFLPMLPLSIVAIIAVGTGLLMLTPLLLFIIHVNAITTDLRFLKSAFSPKVVYLSALSFLIIPVIISANYLNDKYVLNKALNYLYSPDYSKEYEIDKTSLHKAVNSIKHNKVKQSRASIYDSQIPYLSAYYNWLVFDNLTLSNAKVDLIERVFLGKSGGPGIESESLRGNTNVYITDIKSSSVFDETQQVWKSRVDIEITNHNENLRNQEYATSFELPEGCWISDYYLYVGDRMEPGILAEKKSAMWIYSQIRGENRDPGILYYLTGRNIAFKVFPFEKNETRKTGIEFLHKEPVSLNIDSHVLELGEENISLNQIFETENMVYIPAVQKQILKPVMRKPYFHFLIDISAGKEEYIECHTASIELMSEKYKTLSENAKVSFVNSYVNTMTLNDEWKQIYHTQTFNGGFFLDRAIKTALIESNNSEYYPVIIVVTDDYYNAVLDNDFLDLEFTFPENNLFFHLNDITITIQSLIKYPRHQIHTTTIHSIDTEGLRPIYTLNRLDAANITVLEYKLPNNTTAYLPDNNKPSIILKKDIFTIYEPMIREKSWLSALAMEGKQRSQILHPETSDDEWLNMVKYSFKSKIMTPVTSYLVVENEAQKAVLKKKQEQVLSGNKNLDINSQRMSEPNILILILILGGFLWCKRKSIKV